MANHKRLNVRLNKWGYTCDEWHHMAQDKKIKVMGYRSDIMCKEIAFPGPVIQNKDRMKIGKIKEEKEEEVNWEGTSYDQPEALDFGSADYMYTPDSIIRGIITLAEVGKKYDEGI